MDPGSDTGQFAESLKASRQRLKAGRMATLAQAEFGQLDSASRAHARFLVSNAGLDWFVILARLDGKPGCSPETAEMCRAILLERLEPPPSRHRR